MKRAQILWHVGRFWTETFILYHHHWRPRPKGVTHLMHFGEGQAMWCSCGRSFR
jgi:hypothetical protein